MVVRLLVIHGAGIERRGKFDIATFGPMTMEDYNAEIHRAADTLEVEVETFHSLESSHVIAKLSSCRKSGIHGVIINPAGFTQGHPDLSTALIELGLPVLELHMSNPAKRGIVSTIAPSVMGVVAGLGIQGYLFAIHGLRDIVLKEAETEATFRSGVDTPVKAKG